MMSAIFTKAISGEFAWISASIRSLPRRESPRLLYGMFHIACHFEQPSNKRRLHTVCHGGTVTYIVSWYNLRRVARVCTSRRYTRRFMVFEFEQLLLSSGALTHMLTPLAPPCIRLSFSGPTIKTSVCLKRVNH